LDYVVRSIDLEVGHALFQQLSYYIFYQGGEGAELCAWSLGETGHDGVELSVSV